MRNIIPVILVKDPEAYLASPLAICGVSVIERQLRTLKACGYKKIKFASELLCDAFRAFIERTLETNALYKDIRFDVLSSETIPADEDDYILLDGNYAVDRRIIDFIGGNEAGLTLLDDQNRPYRCQKLSVKSLDGKPPRFSFSTKGRSVKASEEIGIYDANCRTKIPLVYEEIRTEQAAQQISGQILANAQKGTLDWPATYIHPFFEDFIVKKIWQSFVTPNQVTIVSGLFGVYLIYLFYSGAYLPALLGVLVMGVLDGVDGKLARVKLLTSQMGELEHTMDKLLEYGWYAALGYSLSGASGDWRHFYFSCGTIICLFLDMLLCSYFLAKKGIQLDDVGTFERVFRKINARRNTHFWLLLPFGLLGAWETGNKVIFYYAATSLSIKLWRAIHHRHLKPSDT